MAQLKRSKDDGHLYILGGPSQGTWQVSEKAEHWLCANDYRIPGRDESTEIEGGTFCRLRDEGYLYIYGLPYDKHDTPSLSQQEPEAIPSGLPLLLELKEGQHRSWALAVDLTLISEEAWVEMQRYKAIAIHVAGSPTPVLFRRLSSKFYTLHVEPQSQPYRISWEDGRYKRHELRAEDTPLGLNPGWQGNVFVESTYSARTWRRCLPKSAISFTGSFLWLARSYHESERPPNTSPIGHPYESWQLWHVVVDNKNPVQWEELKRWFSYRSIDVVPHYQRLEIVSPPEAVTGNGWYITTPSKPLLLRCDPSGKYIEGISKRVYVSAVAVNSPAPPSQIAPLQHTHSASIPSDEVSYFSWAASQQGEFRIRIAGDSTSEPVLIRVASSTNAKPPWLHGLRCTVASGQVQHTFHAFKETQATDSSDEAHKAELLNQFATDELPALKWVFEPEGLPIRVTWEYHSAQGMPLSESESPIQSGKTLTVLWQEKIWPTISHAAQAKITLDGASFGYIELLFISSSTKDEKPAWCYDSRLLTQFCWLSRIVCARPGQAQVVVPASLRKALGQFRAQTDANSPLYIALDRLARVGDAPVWIIVRLQALVAQAQEYQG